MAALDLLAVVMLITFPQSYMLWLSSSEYAVPVWYRVWLFVVPAFFVGLRWFSARASRGRGTSDGPAAAVVIAVIVWGGVQSALFAGSPWHTASIYGQQLWWFALGALFLRGLAGQPREYPLTLVRRFALLAATTAVIFAVADLLADPYLPQYDVIRALPGTPAVRIAVNYFVTLGHSGVSVFGLPVPRFGFLFREPRLLAPWLLVGLILQVEHWRTSSVRSRGAALGAAVIGAGIVLTHSAYGYVTGVVAAAFLAGGAFAPRARTQLRLVVLAVVLAAALPSLLPESLLARATAAFAAISGKPTATVSEALGLDRAFVDTLGGFPLGTGLIANDARPEVVLSGGTTLTSFFAQNAGWVGLAALVFLLWRLCGHLQRLACSRRSIDRTGALIGGVLILAATTVLGGVMLSPAGGPFVFGALIAMAQGTSADTQDRRS